MKNRLKGLLAFWLCVIMLAGGSMTAMAADFYTDENGNITVDGQALYIDYEIKDDEENFISGSGAVLVSFINQDGNTCFTYDRKNYESVEIPSFIKGKVMEIKAPVNRDDGVNGKHLQIVVNIPTGGVEGSSVPEPIDSVIPAVPSCEHDMIYEILREPTEELDGEWAYRCSKCSHIQQTFPICGLLEFCKRVVREVNTADAGAAVSIITDRWMSFNKDVYDALAANPDVALTINFRHQGKFYRTTIPAGTDMTPYLSEDGYCGFLYLAYLFGLTEIVQE